ncbi:17-beta-hydroxysteroid dehydrogenase type 2 [Eublepharis macularius]|uniref:17-beta-hydroxysteroid dehydrogenase type 2 n=1 Tax=Eublepharis macularius TaxID=481883 RepID=A0AA97KJ36_EUBMA|nr:17-beta-hydroxysteroid dehydrogenase type 2 [Eublepharis macularius]
MAMNLSEAGNSLLIYLGVTLVFGGAIFYRAKKKHVEKEMPFWCGLFMLFVLEILCFATLRSLLGLAVFSLACLLYCFYIPASAMLPVDQKAVLITGSDSGIGHELAKFLDRSGFVVFAGVLNERGPGAEELRRASSERLSVLQLDITDSQQIQEAFLEVKKKLKNAALWGIVNNAGILGFPADAELLPMSNYKRCMEVNFFGPVEVSKAFMPLLRKSKGRLINISSMAGGIPMPKFAAYGASKAALSMFSGVMRQELSKWGIKVAVVHPSAFRTSIQGTPEQWSKLEQNLLEKLTPDVKEDYGEDYILALKNILPHIPTTSRPDLSPVLLDVWHALLAVRPQGLYTPGKSAYKYLFIFHYFPLWFYDRYMSKLERDSYAPKALKATQTKNKNS